MVTNVPTLPATVSQCHLLLETLESLIAASDIDAEKTSAKLEEWCSMCHQFMADLQTGGKPAPSCLDYWKNGFGYLELRYDNVIRWSNRPDGGHIGVRKYKPNISRVVTVFEFLLRATIMTTLLDTDNFGSFVLVGETANWQTYKPWMIDHNIPDCILIDAPMMTYDVYDRDESGKLIMILGELKRVTRTGPCVAYIDKDQQPFF